MSSTRKNSTTVSNQEASDRVSDPLYFHPSCDPNLKRPMPMRRQSTSQLRPGTSKMGLFKQPSLPESFPSAPVTPAPKR